MIPKPTYATVILAAMIVCLAFDGPRAATVREMDNDAREFFDNKDYNRAIGLWLNCLEIEPENEKIQQMIELVYEIKQRKDISFQKARLNYRIARKKLREDDDKELEAGIVIGKRAVDDYVYAYRLDPNDGDMKDALNEMKILDEEIRAVQERLRLSRLQREKVERLKAEATAEMALEYPNYEKARDIWKEVLRYVPQDNEALEGKRKCDFAIENRIKFEKIRMFMARGVEFFDRKEYGAARVEFGEVLKVDPKHRDARDYLEKIDDAIEEGTLITKRRQQAEDAYRSGIGNIANNRFDEARQDFETALALVADYRDAKQRLQEIDRLRGEFEKREKARRLQEINQKFQEGIIAYTRGQYREAIDALVTTLSLDKKNIQAKEYLQRARDALRITEEETVDPNSRYYDVVNSLAVAGRSLYERGQYAESKKKWDSILKLFPQNKVAREYVIKCDLMVNPDDREGVVASRVLEGRAYLKKKEYRNALRTFNLIKSIDRNYPGLDTLIAQSNAGLNEAETRDVAPADRAEVNRRYQAGMNLYQMGGKVNIEKALAQFRWVVQKDPGNIKAVIIVNKIESELRMGGVEAERQQVLTAKQRELVNKYYYNGINYYTNNNFDKAIGEWRKVLAIDPGNVKARNNIRKVLAFMQR